MSSRFQLATVVIVAFGMGAVLAEERQTPGISPEQFAKVHKLIRPQPGESRWREISWLTSLWEARIKAAAEGKPIVVWSGSGGAPLCHT
jgi:hypothetical protein